jgi:hypothetical protein
MAETTGATTTMEQTRAWDFYRRAGFDGIAIRDRPSIRRRKDFVPCREWNLEEGRTYELIVYPELTLREKSWTFWGNVTEFTATAVVLRRIGGESAGTFVTIPFRYFQDGRVLRWAGAEKNDESSME